MKVTVLTPAGEYSPLPSPFSLSSLCSCVFCYGFSPLFSFFLSLCFFLFFSLLSSVFSFCLFSLISFFVFFAFFLCFSSLFFRYLCFLSLFFAFFFLCFCSLFCFLCSTDYLVFIGIDLPLPQPMSLLLISTAGGVSFY
jgi:hypothetical protein